MSYLGAPAWGYGWQFPKARSTTIGNDGREAKNPRIKSQLATYRARLDDGSDARFKGHFLPFGDYRRIPGKGRVLLTGDAAGHAAAEAIATGRPRTALPAYSRVLRPVHRALHMACWLRPLMFRA
ncbi:hypothetical protein [Roseovarius sp. Pro17]|uniref:hypothetical protein n=1 Tax=Roseovarius sp. Pro17 TaxID=3108175 RepID=UPI002D781B08|nr:hypothetical protein [Roseovarius sp. Pro17]